jgi:hypothetical protein
MSKNKKNFKKDKVKDVDLRTRLGVSQNGEVLLQFNVSVDLVLFSPEQAREMADGLIQCAEVIEAQRDSTKLFGPNGNEIGKS